MDLLLFLDKKEDDKKEGLTITEIIKMGQEINSDWIKNEVEKKIGSEDKQKENKK